MKLPLQITWRRLQQSDAIEAAIRKRAEQLSNFYDHIMSCRVMVEAPHSHHRKGNLYHIRLDIGVPGGEIVVNRDPAAHGSHEDVYVAIRDAFDAAKRQLQDYARRQRGDVKTHEAHLHAKVLRVFPEQGYGFLLTPDKREVYFERNSLINGDFGFLNPGTEVLYIEEQGNKGPQARQVTIGKHHMET
ncbi:MAG: HPF/RaiA family ribosome-associated protein [Gammaproteobacteria bacterium]|nr:HPF/RaiA family ribosome-associated protein [Gammaproteobacteria bacterium]